MAKMKIAHRHRVRIRVVVWAFIILVVLLGGFLILHTLQRSTSKHTASPPPKKPAAVTQSALDEKIAHMSLRDKIASLLIIHTPGTDSTTLQQFTDTYQPGGFILMDDNIPASNDAMQTITHALHGADSAFPRLIAIDEEGGTVKRLAGDTFDSAETLKDQPVDDTISAFLARSEELQRLGITLNFGIIADTTADPSSFIYPRVLGTDPASASARVAAAVQASRNKTLSTLKHFPGHGETTSDSHSTIPTIVITYNDWQQRDEPPFQAGINAGANAVMMGHLRYTAVDNPPASLSQKWHAILRQKLRFKGIIVTDDMFMLQDSGDPSYADPAKNAVTALQAGNTMLLYVTNHGDANTNIDPGAIIDAVVAAVAKGELSEATITKDARQVLSAQQLSATLKQ